jgi:hypothetical protein
MSADNTVEMFREALEAAGLRLDDTSAHVVDASDCDVTDWALRRKILKVQADNVDLREIALPGSQLRSNELSRILAGQ